MNLTKKIWHDENSQPPKNYLWAKGGKLFKNIEGQWKEVSKKDSEDEGSGGDSTPTETYIKFKAENFGVRDHTTVPDTVDRSKGYRLDEILDMSDSTVENFISGVENNIENYPNNLNYASEYFGRWSPVTEYGDFNYPQGTIFNYLSIESGEYSEYSDGTCFPFISMAFLKRDGTQTIQSTLLLIDGTNFTGKSWTPPKIAFEKHKDDGLWYIAYAY